MKRKMTVLAWFLPIMIFVGLTVGMAEGDIDMYASKKPIYLWTEGNIPTTTM